MAYGARSTHPVRTPPNPHPASNTLHGEPSILRRANLVGVVLPCSGEPYAPSGEPLVFAPLCRISCALLNHAADEDEDEDKDANETNADATSTMMLSHHVTQSQINQNNHWNEELDRIQGCNNGDDEDAVDTTTTTNNNNKNDELHVGMQDGYYYKDRTQVEEATTYPNPAQDYSPSDNNKSQLGEPLWHDVDNPGAWDCFCYQSKFEKGSGGRYMYHKLPSGCTPGWTFHYQNWVPEEDTPTFSRRYTSMLNGDALFFYQLLLPFHTDEEDEKQANKTRQRPFYSEVLKWTNNYANQSNTGKGHYIRRFKLSELFHFDGIVYLHGVLEGKKGSICYRWINVDALYSREIAKKMSWYRWRQIKFNLKLNCNHEAKYNRLLWKDDMSKFNYAYKFDYIYETLIHNIRYFSKKGCSDLCMDESSWAYYGFCGPMVDYLKGKIFSRGGQTVILSDDIFTKYVIPEIGKLWLSPPHLTADNFFNGDSILDWMGGLGFGMIKTVAQNRLPKTVEDKYFHKENVSSASAKRCSRVARLCNPVTMVKEVPARAEAGRFTKGTGACNIGSVNSLDSNGFFMWQKERGRGRGKRKWGTEMNHLRQLYLQTYGKLDQIDSAIWRSNIVYKSWKYYHAPINHAKALTVLTAFDMYQELSNGTAIGF
eukprot:jgi/Psemu1/691/gm1.691_g